MRDAYDDLLDSLSAAPVPQADSDAPTWQAFDADSGSLGIPRASMPQIKSEHRGAMVQYLKGRGITHEQVEIAPNTLKPTQAEWSPEKVNKARGFTGKQRSILVSSDDHVVDGHHQWLSSRDDSPDKPIPAIKFNAPIHQVLLEAARFPSSGVDKESTPAAASDPATAAQKPERDAYDDLLDELTTKPTKPAAPMKSAAPPVPARSVPALPAPSAPTSTAWRNMREFVERDGFTVTSDTGGKHNRGSLHYAGRAVDVRTKDKTPEEVERLIRKAIAAGFTVRDERTRPEGQAEWDGEHVHLELPDGAADPDEYDMLLSDLVDAPAPAAAPDEYDALLDEVEAEADPVETVNSVPASVAVAPAVPASPSPDPMNPYSSEDRAQRDAAAGASVAGITFKLSRALPDYADSAELMREAYTQGAAARNVPADYAQTWLNNNPDALNLVRRDTNEAHTPSDLVGSSAYDPSNQTVRLELERLDDMARDYEAHRSIASRAADFVTDPTTTTGEKATDVLAAGVDYAMRPLGALSTGAAGLQRSVSTSIGAALGDDESQKVMDADTYSPANVVKATWERFKTGEVPEGFEQPIAQGLDLLYQKKNKTPLPAWRRMALELIGDPLTYASANLAGDAAKAFKGTRIGQKLFEPRGLTVLNIEKAADDGRYFVTLKDAEGVTHQIETTAFYEGGQKPKLKARRAGEDIEGVGLERDGDTGRVFHNGQPQSIVMDSDGTMRASIVGGKAQPSQASTEPLAAQLEAIRAGQRAVVDVPAGEKFVVPHGLRSIGKPHGGRIVYDPELVERADVVRHMDEGTLDELITANKNKPEPGRLNESAFASLSPSEKVRKLARETQHIVNITKALPTGFDASALGNQGGIIAASRPSLIPGAVREAAKATVSKGSYEGFQKWLVMSPKHELREKAKLFLTSIGAPEENFASHYVGKIPGLAASQRNFNVTLDYLRANAFDKYADELLKEGITFESNPKAYQDIARFINVATGRGEMGKLEPLADVLSLPLFSPRLLASKFNILSPFFYRSLDESARKIALREMFRATSRLGITKLVAKVAGAGVALNPFDEGFGTIDADGTSYDLSGGRLRAVRFAFQMADSFNKQLRGERVKEERRPDALAERFMRAYLSPTAALAYDWQAGEEFDGTPFEWNAGQIKRVAPFFAREMYEAYKAAGGGAAAKTIPAFAGAGVHTREKWPEPIKPVLSEENQGELERLGIDLDHLGKNGKKNASINPNYKTEDAAGESVRAFGGVVGKPGREVAGMGIDAEQVAKGFSDELDQTLTELFNSPDYESFEDDETRATYVDMLIMNIHQRHMNPVRRDARFEQQDREKKVEQRLDRMSGGAAKPVVKNFKL